MNLLCGSVMDELWMNGMFLLTKIETPLCFVLSVDENILSNCLSLIYCNSGFVRWVSCIKHKSAFNFIFMLKILCSEMFLWAFHSGPF